MSIFFNVTPQFLSQSGDPFAGGVLYFGEPNVDPVANPKAIYLDEELTVEAANPQALNARGVPSQGTIYLADSPAKYSLLVLDANGNQIANVPSFIGVPIASDLNNLPPVTINDSVTVVGVTDATVIIDSGVSSGAEGALDYRESGVSQWRWLRQAIIDGGAMILRRVAGAGSPDEPVEYPVAGGVILRWLGTIRLQITNLGVSIPAAITDNKQVLVAAGTFLNDGTPVGENFGISGVTNAGTGDYTVTLDFFPVAEVNLSAESNAELSGVTQISRAVGGANASGTVKVYTNNGGTGALENCTSFSVQVFDLGAA